MHIYIYKYFEMTHILRWRLLFMFFFLLLFSLSLSLRPPRSLAWKKLRVLTQRRQTFDNMWKMLRRCVCVDLHVFNVDLQMKHSEPAYLSNFLLYLRCDTLCNRSRGKYLEPQKCRDWKFAMRGKQPKHIAPPLELYPFEWSRCNDVVSQVRWIRGEMAHIGQNRIGKGQDRWAAGCCYRDCHRLPRWVHLLTPLTLPKAFRRNMWSSPWAGCRRTSCCLSWNATWKNMENPDKRPDKTHSLFEHIQTTKIALERLGSLEASLQFGS